MRLIHQLGLLFLFLGFTSCGAYKNSILFKTDGNIDNAGFKAAMKEADRNYVVQKYDYLTMHLYTSQGEILLDPNSEIENVKNNPAGRNNNALIQNNQLIVNQVAVHPQLVQPNYLVNEDGLAYMPLIGGIQVAGLRVYQLDSLFSKAYQQYYKDSYTMTRVINRRVVVMGAMGNKVIPLSNENMNLLEVVSLAGNLDINMRADRIRLIRNPLDSPQIQLINLTTWEGLKAANLRVEPNDVIYIEPRRRIARREALSDIGTAVGIVSGMITPILTILVLVRQL